MSTKGIQMLLARGGRVGSPEGRTASNKSTVKVVNMAATEGDDLAARKDSVTARLQQREDERQSKLVKRREETWQNKGQKCDIYPFVEGGEKLRAALLSASDSAAFQQLSAEIQGLQKKLNDSVMVLSSYDIRKTQDMITGLREQFQQQYSSIQPKKKFAFKAKKKQQPEAVGKEQAAGDSAATAAVATPTVELVGANSVCGLSDATIEKLGDDVNRKDVLASALRGCTLRLLGAPSAAHLTDLKNCTILLGPVASSVFIDDCTGCTFVVACHQLRIHNTVDSQFYIHVTSKAIIEDSKGLTFAPYAWQYAGLDADFATSGLSKAVNNWDQIDDFNWLASDEPSPNWRVMDEVKRLTF